MSECWCHAVFFYRLALFWRYHPRSLLYMSGFEVHFSVYVFGTFCLTYTSYYWGTQKHNSKCSKVVAVFGSRSIIAYGRTVPQKYGVLLDGPEIIRIKARECFFFLFYLGLWWGAHGWAQHSYFHNLIFSQCGVGRALRLIKVRGEFFFSFSSNQS